MRFNEFNLTEKGPVAPKKAGRSRGEAMEEVIVSAVNKTMPAGDTFGIDPKAGKNVAKFLVQNGIKGKGEVLGADQLEVTPIWSKYWDRPVPPSTKTPKTDFIIGDAKISLKTGGAAQLMSGGKNESVATFYAAMDKTKGDMQSKLVKKLTNMFENLAPASVASGQLAKVIKDKSDEVVNKANQAHKELMGELVNIFAENTKFRDAFAFEAMSGQVKFGGGLGTCTHFLVTDFDGKKNSLHPVTDKKYVRSIAEQMKVSVRFKTTSVKTKAEGKTGAYRYWSVVGLIIDKMQQDAKELSQNESLNEGTIADFFKGVWEKLKAIFASVINYLSKSIKNLFDFFDVEPEVEFNNVVQV
jgi:hypothetical protein